MDAAMAGNRKQIARRLDEIEVHMAEYDKRIMAIFQAIRELMTPA